MLKGSCISLIVRAEKCNNNRNEKKKEITLFLCHTGNYSCNNYVINKLYKGEQNLSITI